MSMFAKTAAKSAITGDAAALGALAFVALATKKLTELAVGGAKPDETLTSLVIPGGSKEFLKAAFESTKKS